MENSTMNGQATSTINRSINSKLTTTATPEALSVGPTTITEHEAQQVERANATGLQPIVFVHGLWLLPSSWDRWATLFEEAGYTAVTPSWPDDPETVGEANANPEIFANKTVGQVADHFDGVIHRLTKKPAIIGHSFGGLLVQILAGRGLSAATVAIDPAPFRGVLPLPLSALKSTQQTAIAPSRSLSSSSALASPTRLAMRKPRSFTRPSLSRLRVRRCSKPPPPTSIRGPRQRSTSRIQNVGLY